MQYTLETYLSEEIYYQVLRDNHDAFLSNWEQKKSEHSEDIKRMYQWTMSSMVCEIKEGGTASNTFLSMVNATFEGDIEETRKQLLEYCKLDTFAMVKILEKLLKV